MTEHDELRVSLGAYLLGSLDPADHAVVAAHVHECPACRDELAELAGLPGLLGLLDADEAAQVGPVDDSEGAERVVGVALARIDRARRRRRMRWLAASAAAVVLAVGGTAAGTVAVTAGQAGHGGTTAQAVTVAATDSVTGVHASARLRAEPTGTAITLHLTGVTPGLRCKLVAAAVDGHRETASTWIADYVGDVDISGTTAIPENRLAHLNVVTTSGAHLVTLPAPH